MKIAIQGVPDPVQNGIAQGWKVFHAGLLTESKTIECDVVIVGTAPVVAPRLKSLPKLV